MKIQTQIKIEFTLEISLLFEINLKCALIFIITACFLFLIIPLKHSKNALLLITGPASPPIFQGDRHLCR